MQGPLPGASQLHLIGGFSLADHREVYELTDPAQRLVAFLALRPRAQPRLLVAGCLWPDKTESRALANLRSALWALHTATAAPVVRVNAQSLQLLPTIQVDVQTVQRQSWSLIERSAGDGDGDGVADSELARSKELLFEDLLPGWYDDWVLLERERFAELQVHALDVLVGALVSASRHSHAINLGLRLVAMDPLRERSQVALIRAYLAEGSFGRARRQHDAYCRLMSTTFGRPYEPAFEDFLDAELTTRRAPSHELTTVRSAEDALSTT